MIFHVSFSFFWVTFDLTSSGIVFYGTCTVFFFVLMPCPTGERSGLRRLGGQNNDVDGRASSAWCHQFERSLEFRLVQKRRHLKLIISKLRAPKRKQWKWCIKTCGHGKPHKIQANWLFETPLSSAFPKGICQVDTSGWVNPEGEEAPYPEVPNVGGPSGVTCGPKRWVLVVNKSDECLVNKSMNWLAETYMVTSRYCKLMKSDQSTYDNYE